MALPSFLDRWTGRIANAAALWPFFAATGLGGVVTAILSQGVAWISQYGAFGWWVAFLAGAVMTALGIFLAGAARERFARSSALRMWRDRVHDMNPLEGEFTRKRLRLVDLASPIDYSIRGKRFVDCELIGRTNLVLSGSNIHGVEFRNCDFIVMPPGSIIQNASLFENCHMIGGVLFNCTIFIREREWTTFNAVGANLVSYPPPAANPAGPVAS